MDKVGGGLVAALLFVGAAPLAAQPADPAGVRVTSADEERAIAFALERGRLLYALDRAAWVGTDDMVERLPDWRTAGLRGYIVERDGAGFAITFYGGPEAAPVAFYRGRVQNHRVVGREIFPGAARPALTAAQRRLVDARQAVSAATRRRPCGALPFNTAVIPPEAPDGPIQVYLLTPQTQQRQYPLGGHYRSTVAADGTVSGERAFMSSCMTMAAPSANAAAFWVTHLLDPVPTELHVFTAMTSGLPLFVATQNGGRVYEVTGDRVRIITPPPGRRPSAPDRAPPPQSAH